MIKLIEFVGGPFCGAILDLELDINQPYMVFPYKEIFVMYYFKEYKMYYIGAKNKQELLEVNHE
jgi:hypothetical protein